MLESPSRIIKAKGDFRIPPNLEDYEQARATFSWDRAQRELDGLPGGQGLNIAHEAVDRHAEGSRRDHLALRWIGKNGDLRDYTYRSLRDLTNRFANALQGLGVAKGDRVYVLAGRIPELYIAALGTVKNRSVFCPLYSAFGPEPIRARIEIGTAKVLVTTESLYQRKVAALRASLPSLDHVLLVGDDRQPTRVPGTRDFNTLMGEASAEFTIGPTDPEDMALLHFTSGTTGKPKGALHVHQAVVAHHITGRVRSSPAARKLAGELGVDLTTVHGTGSGGAITREDVERAAAAAPAVSPPVPEPDRQVRLRQTIAAAMARSKREIPHYYLSTTIDMHRAMAWLAEENLKRPVADRLLYGVLLIKAVALALKEVPELNALWSGTQAVPSPAIHVGVAISLRQGGLVAPAVHDTDRQSLDELMRNFRDLVARARAGSLRSSELSDPTITVTSIGEQGVETIFGIIYPPASGDCGFWESRGTSVVG